MGLQRLAVIIAALLYILVCCNACPRRRSPPPCRRQDCTYTRWSSWSSCTAKCGSVGIKTRTRSISSGARCGGTCSNTVRQQASCPNTCCPINCRYSWGSWSACSVTCESGTRTRTMRIISREKCGGNRCPSKTTETSACDTGR
jgi:hypothetical protein